MPVPKPGPGEVLMRVQASLFNNRDSPWRAALWGGSCVGLAPMTSRVSVESVRLRLESVRLRPLALL
jgi:NADPH:quinone reductase-like Zn-dependent oxidoreductase